MDVVEPAVVVNPREAGSDVPAPTLRQRLEYGALRMVVALAAMISVERLAAIGAALVGFVGPRLRQNRRALANLAIAFPDKSEAERAAIARTMWANMGRTFAETLALDRIIADPGRIEIVDRQLWAERIALPGPIIGCTLHMGSWEIAIHPFTMLGRTPAGVYKPLENPLIDDWLKATRAPLFPGGLLGKGDRDDSDGTGQRTARQLIDRARSGGTLGFVCDHFDRRGEPVPFMGRMARFNTAPAMIARHVSGRVWLGRALRIGTSSHFRFDVLEIPVPRTGNKKADAAALTAAIFAAFEAWIREAPEQWMWWNTRWVETGEREIAPASTSTGATAT